MKSAFLHELMEGDIVWARVPGITVPWPARLEKKTIKHFQVFCNSDDALINTKKILSFQHAEEMSAKAKHALKKKPKTLLTWLSDLEWAKQEVDILKTTCRNQEYQYLERRAVPDSCRSDDDDEQWRSSKKARLSSDDSTEFKDKSLDQSTAPKNAQLVVYDASESDDETRGQEASHKQPCLDSSECEDDPDDSSECEDELHNQPASHKQPCLDPDDSSKCQDELHNQPASHKPPSLDPDDSSKCQDELHNQPASHKQPSLDPDDSSKCEDEPQNQPASHKQPSLDPDDSSECEDELHNQPASHKQPSLDPDDSSKCEDEPQNQPASHKQPCLDPDDSSKCEDEPQNQPASHKQPSLDPDDSSECEDELHNQPASHKQPCLDQDDSSKCQDELHNQPASHKPPSLDPDDSSKCEDEPQNQPASHKQPSLDPDDSSKCEDEPQNQLASHKQPSLDPDDSSKCEDEPQNQPASHKQPCLDPDDSSECEDELHNQPASHKQPCLDPDDSSKCEDELHNQPALHKQPCLDPDDSSKCEDEPQNQPASHKQPCLDPDDSSKCQDELHNQPALHKQPCLDPDDSNECEDDPDDSSECEDDPDDSSECEDDPDDSSECEDDPDDSSECEDELHNQLASHKQPCLDPDDSSECEDELHIQPASVSCCCHEDVDENLIERDQTEIGIFVRKVLEADVSLTGRRKKSSRVWNKYHCCFICRRLSTNIIKHMLTHKENREVQELQVLRNSTNDKVSKAKQTMLRNQGDHEHNIAVKKQKKGEMLISRKSGNFSAKDYGPCPFCLEWMKLDSLGSRHQFFCPAATNKNGKIKKGEAIVRSSIISGGIQETVSPRLVREVYPIMTRDDVTETAKEDNLIIALGNNWLRQNLGNSLKRKYYTSSRMRGASRLLKNIRAITKTNKSVTDYISPSYFDSMCEAALMCAEMENDDEEDLKSPSTALKISYDINRMANIKLGIALRNGDHQAKREAEEFLSLLKMEWTIRVTRMARLKLRRNQINKPCRQLPLPEDLSVLAGRVVEQLTNLDLRNKKNFRRAQVLLQTRLLTYNKRRSGELEALTLENFKARSRGLDDADRGLLGNDMTDLEKYLVESQELIKIRGKSGKIVPILVPGDSKAALEFICSPAVRQSTGIKSWNPYVFANTGDGVVRAYDSLKEICGQLNLDAPDRITSVSMRKYIATLSQVIDMKDHELQWLCNHLGHTMEIHKLHYRSTSGFIERVNIGKLMMLQDMNLAGKYSGQRLQDIDFSELVSTPPQEESAITRDVHSDTEPEVVEDLCDDVRPAKKMKNSSSTRVAWSQEEEQELKELLADNLKKGRIPRMRECIQAIGRSRRNKGVLHKRKWETIKKKTLRMIQQSKRK